ncbi:peptidoglycan-binding domain-containing protein [Streptomyces sp. TRM49041]|uniref:peptidoglycan-binding domain-containing protein n=1 Tax=Streptomyces sp. TRM49041 TaxID=2603216 RepID=UPI001CA3F9F9|nr:peptidoglycan-binding domain-containing protein [Streptomyces sp. TRM49041]
MSCSQESAPREAGAAPPKAADPVRIGPYVPLGVLGRGGTGRVTKRGFSVGPAGVDGDFGTTDTKNAVLAFQRAKGLAVDGQIGPHTRAALRGTS